MAFCFFKFIYLFIFTIVSARLYSKRHSSIIKYGILALYMCLTSISSPSHYVDALATGWRPPRDLQLMIITHGIVIYEEDYSYQSFMIEYNNPKGIPLTLKLIINLN